MPGIPQCSTVHKWATQEGYGIPVRLLCPHARTYMPTQTHNSTVGELDVRCYNTLKCAVQRWAHTWPTKQSQHKKKASDDKVNDDILVKWCLCYPNVSWLSVTHRERGRKEVQGRWRDHQRGADDSLRVWVAVCVSLLQPGTVCGLSLQVIQCIKVNTEMFQWLRLFQTELKYRDD